MKTYVPNAWTAKSFKTVKKIWNNETDNHTTIFYYIGDYSLRYLQDFVTKVNHPRSCTSVLYSLLKPADCEYHW